MKFAFSTLACPSWTIEEIVDAGVRLGYDGLELRLLDGEVLDPVADAKKIAHAVDLAMEAALPICALDSSCRFNMREAADRGSQVEELLAWIWLAGTLDVPVVRVFGGAPEPGEAVSDEEANARVVEALQQAATVAEREGVIVALETHDDFSSARRLADVLAEVPSSWVGALWDSHHPYRMGESAEEVIALLGKRIVHVHVKDARRVGPNGSDWQLVLLGEGEVPVRQQLEALQRAGYAGYVSIEMEKKWHPELPEPEVALPSGIAWLRRQITRATTDGHDGRRTLS